MDTTGPQRVIGSEEPKERLRYTLAQLLADSDCFQPMLPEEREWVDAPRVGRELI
jgi:antitoxin ChpS